MVRQSVVVGDVTHRQVDLDVVVVARDDDIRQERYGGAPSGHEPKVSRARVTRCESGSYRAAREWLRVQKEKRKEVSVPVILK